MTNHMLAQHKITRIDDGHIIAQMKRGSRRGVDRKTPISTTHWIPDQVLIAFPGYIALPVAVSN